MNIYCMENSLSMKKREILMEIFPEQSKFSCSIWLTRLLKKTIDPLHEWRLYLINNTYTSLASHSWEKSFVLKHEYEAEDV